MYIGEEGHDVTSFPVTPLHQLIQPGSRRVIKNDFTLGPVLKCLRFQGLQHVVVTFIQPQQKRVMRKRPQGKS